MTTRRKILLGASALLITVASSSSFAAADPGDFTVPAAALVPIGEQQGFYGEGNFGAVMHNYVKNYNPAASSNYDRKNWGWALGGNVGYQFDKFLALEAGFNYFLAAKSKVNQGSVFLPKSGDSVHPYAGYVAAKILAPIVDQVYLFAKAGIGYVRQSIPGLGKNAYHRSYWGPMFAVGGQYYIDENLSVNLTYSRFAGDSTEAYLGKIGPLPDLNAFTVGLGYKFLM